MEMKSRMVVARGWGRRKQGDVNQRIQTCSYKMNKSRMVITVNNAVLYTWHLIRLDLKHSHTKKLNMWTEGYANFLDLGHHSTMYVYSNHHIIHFNYSHQLFLNKVGKNKIKPTFWQPWSFPNRNCQGDMWGHNFRLLEATAELGHIS